MNATITIPVDADTANLYATAPDATRQKLRILLGLWVRAWMSEQHSLSDIMDAISLKAEERGLTPEILESLLNAE